MTIDHAAALPVNPYAAFLDKVSKPARYSGGEVGAVRKAWHSVQARVCLAFPDVYDIGMSHLGYKILYKVLNDDPRTLAERAYCPWVDMLDELTARNLPLVSLESYRPLCDFDVVGFSLQYELTYTNVLSMLELGRIPLRSAHRGQDDPLVLAGGPCATHPEPVAVFFDAIVIGDGEAKLTEVALTWTRLKKEGVPRQQRLVALAQLGAVYVPSLYNVEVEEDTGLQVVVPGPRPLPFPIERSMVKLDDYPFPDDGPTGGPEAIFDRTSIEITRGCTEGCRFCQAGMIYRPVQERDPNQVYDAVLNAVENSGNDEVSLTALSTADVSYIGPLIKKLGPELEKRNVSLSVSSLRAYGLAPELLDELSRVRAGGLTFAPEAGTQRMRDVVNKNVTELQLQETAERVFSRGYKRMKLYFMVGLPSEQDEDVLGVAQTGIRAADTGRRVAGKHAKVTVSVSTHVPKPHTPFQWAAMDSPADIARKHALLRAAVRGQRQVTLRTHDAAGSVLEGIIARGDRRLGDVIERAWRHGARFDSWDEQLDVSRWREALEHYGIDKQIYLSTLPVSARLPWSHIDVGLEDGFLLREYRKALQDRLSPPCGKAAGMFVHHDSVEAAADDKRNLVCYDCGVACDMSQMRKRRLLKLDRLRPHSQAAYVSDEVAKRPPPRDRKKPRVGNPDAGHRYRIHFRKLGPMALLGHLDLVRELPRVFRRLGVSQTYTGGFRPKPDMAFSPALSLGVVSLDEYVDVRLNEAFGEAALPALLQRMNDNSPQGWVFTAAAALGKDDPAITKVVTGARYLITFSRDVVVAAAATVAPALWLASRCETLIAAEQLLLQREAKGIKRQLDVRPVIAALAPATPQQQQQWLVQAGIVGNLVGVVADVRFTPRGSVRARELAQLLLDSEDAPHRAIRLKLWCGAAAETNRATALHLSALRKTPQPSKSNESKIISNCA